MIEAIRSDERPNGTTVTTVKVTGDGETSYVYEVTCDECEGRGMLHIEPSRRLGYRTLAQVEHEAEAVAVADEHVCEPV